MKSAVLIFANLLFVIPYAEGRINLRPSMTDAASTDTHILLSLDSIELEVVRGKAGETVFICDDVQWLNQAGEPRIPWKVMTVLLPPDADSSSVSATVSDIQYESVAGTWEVSPSPKTSEFF